MHGLLSSRGRTRSRGTNNFSRSVSELRIKKDLDELSFRRAHCDFARTRVLLPRGKADLLELRLIISPTKGAYKGGHFDFKLVIPPMYPYNAPEVWCTTKVFHPNICLETGRVFLAIVDDEWRPVMSVSSVVVGLQLMFLEPNPDSAINPEAARIFRTDSELFAAQVQRSLAGAVYGEHVLPDHRIGAPSTDADEGMRAAPRGPGGGGQPAGGESGGAHAAELARRSAR